MDDQNAEQEVLAIERRALDQWAQGNVAAYFERMADDATYFDTIGAQHRIDGRAAVLVYVDTTFVGQVPAHRYALVNPRVQVYETRPS